jgi:hypothetical protein
MRSMAVSGDHDTDHGRQSLGYGIEGGFGDGNADHRDGLSASSDLMRIDFGTLLRVAIWPAPASH